ncbi:MAG: hypothetical protein II918_05165 [Firmicutes bacterium]|nr:hypothetical protein [Bacillota bacterium]
MANVKNMKEEFEAMDIAECIVGQMMDDDEDDDLDDVLDYDIKDVGLMAADIACSVSTRVEEYLRELLKETDPRAARTIFHLIDKIDHIKNIALLRMIFSISGMSNAVDMIDILDTCIDYDETAAELFMSLLNIEDIKDWYMIEVRKMPGFMKKGW